MKKNAGSDMWIIPLIIVVLWSFYCGIRFLVPGDGLIGTTDDMPWGLLISAYAFFVSSIGACFVGSLGSVFRIKKYEFIEKRAIFLAILIVLVGMAVIFVELEHPFRMVTGYITSPNLTSPIWWMGVNYIFYLTFIILEFIFIVRKNPKMAQFVGVFAFLSAVAAHSTVGSVFGVTHARSFWYGPYLPIDFILCAWILGFALMIIVLSLIKSNEQKEELQLLIPEMGKWLAVLIGINVFFVFWKIITGIYAGEGSKYLATLSLIKGPLSFRFWGLEIILGLLLPFILIVGSGNKKGIFFASLFSIIGMFVNKMNMVEAGQIVPLEIGVDKITTYIKYSPTFVEISIVAGAVGFVIISYYLFEKVLLCKS